MLGRNVPGWEGALRNAAFALNWTHTNITYTADLANGPLFWLIANIRVAEPGPNGHGALLDQDPPHYLAWADDAWPLSWRIWGFGPFTTDAYDHLIGTAFDALKALHVLPVVVDGLQELLRAQLLADRDIPQSPFDEPAEFYCGPLERDARADFVPPVMYRSMAFQHFERVAFRGIAWAPLPP